MGLKRNHGYGDYGYGEQKQRFYSCAQKEDCSEHTHCREFAQEENCRQHNFKRPRRVCKPLVDLSEYESFCVSPSHESLLFHLPCETLDAHGQGAVALVESLQLSVTDVSQATEAVDIASQLPLPRGRSGHVCRNETLRTQGYGQAHGLVSQVDREPTSCEQKLMDCKLKIMASRLKYGVDVWSLAAQFVNPYETVPSIATRVLNRAFFKMWELMQLFPALVPPMAKKPKLLSAHLCEGPGGFVQAVHMHRMRNADSEEGLRNGSPSVIDYSGSGDAWFAITLATPSGQGDALKMKMSKLQECSSESVQGHIHYGADQSGDITNPKNISSFVQYVLQKSDGEKMHLITGDGAFDVSDDFSLQEQSHSQLFFCEILIAARLQCPGGALVLKFFDCFTKNTVTLLRILASLYTTVDIVRLRTSRVCNSERFVVAQGFRFLPVRVEDKLMNISAAWYQFVRDGASATLNVSKPCVASFLEALNQGSAAIASEQILSILRAVDVAEDLGKRLSIINVSQHKSILSILRRKLKTVEKLQVNALSLCETLDIPLANSMA